MPYHPSLFASELLIANLRLMANERWCDALPPSHTCIVQLAFKKSSLLEVQVVQMCSIYMILFLGTIWNDRAQEPIFCPAVGDFKQGMVVLQPQQDQRFWRVSKRNPARSELKQNCLKHGNTRRIQTHPDISCDALQYHTVPMLGTQLSWRESEKMLCECLFVDCLFCTNVIQINPISYTLCYTLN